MDATCNVDVTVNVKVQFRHSFTETEEIHDYYNILHIT
jgi:hypothetical protein